MLYCIYPTISYRLHKILCSTKSPMVIFPLNLTDLSARLLKKWNHAISNNWLCGTYDIVVIRIHCCCGKQCIPARILFVFVLWHWCRGLSSKYWIVWIERNINIIGFCWIGKWRYSSSVWWRGLYNAFIIIYLF